jgi:hypothetical protein
MYVGSRLVILITTMNWALPYPSSPPTRFGTLSSCAASTKTVRVPGCRSAGQPEHSSIPIIILGMFTLSVLMTVLYPQVQMEVKSPILAVIQKVKRPLASSQCLFHKLLQSSTPFLHFIFSKIKQPAIQQKLGAG